MLLKPNILMVEDNPGDAVLIRELLNDINIPHNLYLAKDGVMAVHMLHQEGEYSDIPKPNLILLDMNLPKKDGKDVLKDIKQDKTLTDIPVIILTASLLDVEDNPCTKLVDAVLIKPIDLEGFNDVTKSIQDVLNK